MYDFFEPDTPLNAGKVFAVVAMFNLLSLPLFSTTFVINAMSHAAVSVKRLQQFLAQAELPCTCDASDIQQVPPAQPSIKFSTNERQDLDESALHPLILTNNEDKPDISHEVQADNIAEIRSGCFMWDSNDDSSMQLQDVNVSIPKSKLTVIVGGVGSGKSSLLSALLGEMNTISGQVVWKRDTSKAYVAQQTWLMNATLRDNILFTLDYDSVLYEEVIECCALKHDIASLAGGDLIEIGEKGVTLSGGQKQRMSISRALYSGAEAVLMVLVSAY